jgi:hypothetical protein
MLPGKWNAPGAAVAVTVRFCAYGRVGGSGTANQGVHAPRSPLESGRSRTPLAAGLIVVQYGGRRLIQRRVNRQRGGCLLR